MATLNSKTIGPTGDYTTLAAWFAACPSNLTTADATGYIYQGLVQNTELITSFSITGITGVGPAHYIELTAAPGASFLDNANASTNALRYNAANGAAIRFNADYGPALAVTVGYTRISKLQIAGTGTTASAGLAASGTPDYVDINQCIIEGRTAATTASVIGENSKIRNSLIVARHATPTTVLALGYGVDAYNCTVVSLAGTATNGIDSSYGTVTLKNVYVGNATNVTAGSSTFNKTTSFTSVSGPPSGWSAAAFSTATFESITDGSHDFRLKTGSALIDSGTTESTYAANDVIGTTRSGTWDVGAWEVSAAAGATIDGNLGTASASGFVASIAAAVTISCALGGAVASGNQATISTGSNVTITASLGTSIASGYLAAVVSSGSATITTDIFKNNTGTVLASTSIAKAVAIKLSDLTLAASWTSQTTNGSGVLSLTSAGMTTATDYLLVVSNADGSAVGVKKYTAV